MASLDDYKWYDNNRRNRAGGLRWRRLWLQTALSTLLLLAVAAFIGNEGGTGQAARYLAGTALAPESSWFWFGHEQPSLAASAALPPVEDSADAVSEAPRFMAPASGVVVKDLVLDADGITCEHGIIIQGVAGQSVKAAAAGEVLYLGESSNGFVVEIGHTGGFSSIYQGLSELSVGAGQEVAAGETIGVTASGEVMFALFLHDQEADPLVYLFQQQV